MKTKIISLAAAGLLAISMTANVAADDYKIGAVNVGRLFNESPQAADVRTKLEKEFGARERELIEEQKKLKELQDRLQKDSAIMSEAERKRLERDLVTLQRDSQRNQNEYRDDVTFRRNEEIANVQTELLKAIQAVAQAQSFDIVLPDSAVVFISNRVDITQQVIDYIKKNAPAPAAAPAKANP